MDGWFQLKFRDKFYETDAVRHLFNGNRRLCFRWVHAEGSEEQNPTAEKCGACLQIIRSKRCRFTDPDAEQTAKDILAPKRRPKRASRAKQRVVLPDPTPPVAIVQAEPPKPAPKPANQPRTPMARPAPPPPPHDPKRIPTVAERIEFMRLQKLARQGAK
jgi:hypothetical protein